MATKSENVQALDEMLLTDGNPQPASARLYKAIASLGEEGLKERGNIRDAYLDRQGITFSLSGTERPLPLDLIPRMIAADEWNSIEAGIIQRIKALEMFLADVYGEANILRDGIIPRKLVTSSSHFHRAAYGINPPNGVRIHVAGVDLVRDEFGQFRVLEDNLRCPSGVSYMLENRRTLSHVVPEFFSGYRVRNVADYPERLLDALRAAAPLGVENPTVAVLTPGVHNSAHFEHAFLARRMGVELVEGRDLYVRHDQVWMRTTRGPKPVHVLYRRIDDEFLDPVQFKPDSVLGVPGILNVARAGKVALANAVGNGVADDKAIYPYVPDFIAYYLNEAPLLPNVPTYDLQDFEQRQYVLERLERMVVKPSDGSGGYGIVIGNKADARTLEDVAKSIEADPRNWIAQPIVQLSTSPTVVESGAVEPRHIDLRPFAVNDGERISVVPGGLTRVALPQGSLVVNSSQGGGSKDTWVLEGESRSSGNPQRINPPPRLQRVRSSNIDRNNAPTIHDERLRQQEGQQQQEKC